MSRLGGSRLEGLSRGNPCPHHIQCRHLPQTTRTPNVSVKCCFLRAYLFTFSQSSIPGHTHTLPETSLHHTAQPSAGSRISDSSPKELALIMDMYDSDFIVLCPGSPSGRVTEDDSVQSEKTMSSVTDCTIGAGHEEYSTISGNYAKFRIRSRCQSPHTVPCAWKSYDESRGPARVRCLRFLIQSGVVYVILFTVHVLMSFSREPSRPYSTYAEGL